MSTLKEFCRYLGQLRVDDEICSYYPPNHVLISSFSAPTNATNSVKEGGGDLPARAERAPGMATSMKGDKIAAPNARVMQRESTDRLLRCVRSIHMGQENDVIAP